MPGTARVADRVTGDIARWAAARQIAPVAMAAFSLGFAIIAAAWFTGPSARTQVTGFAFLVASVLAARVARTMSDAATGTARQVTAAADWGRAACVMLAELAVYAGLAGGASLSGGTSDGFTGPLGPQLRGGIADRFGGHGAAGVWLLAVEAAVVIALLPMAGLCAAGPPARLPRLGSLRLLAAGLAVLLGGPRAGVLVALVLGVLGLLYVLVRPSDTVAGDASVIAGYRGDGPLSAWAGGFVRGRLPPMAPLLVGLLVTCMLTALGLRNLPGILVLTPAEAMLLAALGSSHLHGGPHDWRVPPLLHAGEYVFLGAAGYAARVPAPVTFGLIAVVGLRHLDMAYRARNRVPLSWFMTRERSSLPRADWRGLGWEGRMIVAGLAVLFGIAPVIYPALAAYLGLLAVADFLGGWANAALAAIGSGGHAAVDG